MHLKVERNFMVILLENFTCGGAGLGYLARGQLSFAVTRLAELPLTNSCPSAGYPNSAPTHVKDTVSCILLSFNNVKLRFYTELYFCSSGRIYNCHLCFGDRTLLEVD